MELRWFIASWRTGSIYCLSNWIIWVNKLCFMLQDWIRLAPLGFVGCISPPQRAPPSPSLYVNCTQHGSNTTSLMHTKPSVFPWLFYTLTGNDLYLVHETYGRLSGCFGKGLVMPRSASSISFSLESVSASPPPTSNKRLKCSFKSATMQMVNYINGMHITKGSQD